MKRLINLYKVFSSITFLARSFSIQFPFYLLACRFHLSATLADRTVVPQNLSCWFPPPPSNLFLRICRFCISVLLSFVWYDLWPSNSKYSLQTLPLKRALYLQFFRHFPKLSSIQHHRFGISPKISWLCPFIIHNLESWPV